MQGNRGREMKLERKTIKGERERVGKSQKQRGNLKKNK